MAKKKKSKVRNCLGHFQAIGKIIQLNHLTIISGITTIVTVLVTIVMAILGENNTILLIVTISSSAVTLLAFIYNVIKAIIKQRRIIIHPYNEKELDLFYDVLAKEDGHQILKSGKARLYYSSSENEYVKNNIATLKFNFKGNPRYSIINDTKCNAFKIFSEYLSKNKYFYDEKKIRMNNGIDELLKTKQNEQVVQLSKTTYFNSVCTNQVASQEMRYDDDAVYCFDGYALVRSRANRDKNGRIYSLSESQCSNHIGVSTLVITKDKFTIITQQGKKNIIDSNKFIVSASGSLDLDDRKKCNYFGDIIKKGMIRELHEECNIDYKNILDTEIIGFGRLLDRGGKPEFFGITNVNINADELIENALKGKEHDTEYVTAFKKVEFDLKEIEGAVSKLGRKNATAQLLYYVDVLLRDYFNTHKSNL